MQCGKHEYAVLGTGFQSACGQPCYFYFFLVFAAVVGFASECASDVRRE